MGLFSSCARIILLYALSSNSCSKTSHMAGIVDQSHFILCLLESEAPDGHQIAVEMISGDGHSHTANLPTSVSTVYDLI